MFLLLEFIFLLLHTQTHTQHNLENKEDEEADDTAPLCTTSNFACLTKSLINSPLVNRFGYNLTR